MKLKPYFQTTEDGDGVFNVEAVKIKFGFGALREVGAEARAFGITRAAIYTDKNVAKLEPVALAVDALKKEGIDAAVYAEVEVEPTDRSFKASAEFAMKHVAVLEQQTQQICIDRETLFHELKQVNDLHVFPSKANFILVRVADGQADNIFNQLKEQCVLIKNLNPTGGLLKDCLRITVGTPEENAAFLNAFQIALAG